MRRFELQPAYILHARPYRETSLLLELFTPDYGRVGAVAKGGRGPSRRAKGLLQPFVPLLIGCVGRGELLTLTNYDTQGIFPYLKGRSLVSAFYLNELLMRLLQHWDANPELFQGYERAINGLSSEDPIEPVLRLFEKVLLKTLGYELQLTKEVETGAGIDPEGMYCYDPERGPMLASLINQSGELNQSPHLYRGESLLALAEERLTDLATLGDAKRLIRQALLPHLGSKPIESRRLL